MPMPSSTVSARALCMGRSISSAPTTPAPTASVRISSQLFRPNRRASSADCSLNSPSAMVAMPSIRHRNDIAWSGLRRMITPSTASISPSDRSN